MKFMLLLGLVALLLSISNADLSENESAVMEETETKSDTTETSPKEKRGTQSNEGIQYNYPTALTSSNSGSFSSSYNSGSGGAANLISNLISGNAGSNYVNQGNDYLSGEVLSRGVNSMAQGVKPNVNVGSLLSSANYLAGADAGILGSSLGGLNLNPGLFGKALGEANSLVNGLSGYGGSGLYSLDSGLNFGQLSNANLGSLGAGTSVGAGGSYGNSGIGGSISYDSLSNALKGGVNSIYGSAGLGYGNGGLSYGTGSFGIENSIGSVGASLGNGGNYASNYIPISGNLGGSTPYSSGISGNSGGSIPYSGGFAGGLAGLAGAGFQGIASALQDDLTTSNKIGPVTFGQGQTLQDSRGPNLQQQQPIKYNAPPSYSLGSRGLGHYASSGDIGSKGPQILYSQSYKQSSPYFGAQSSLSGPTSSHGIFYKGPLSPGNYLPSNSLSIQGSLSGKFSGSLAPNSYVSSGPTRLQSSFSLPSSNLGGSGNLGAYSPGFSRGHGFSGNNDGGYNSFSSGLGSQYSSSQLSPNFAVPMKLSYSSGSMNGGYLSDSDSSNSYNTISYSIPIKAKGYSPN